jgi:predicted ATPase
MQIKNFKFDDHKRNWHIEETVFDNFNLLVGISGVGKTRILKALELVYEVATDGDYKLDGVAWKIGFEHANHEYEWRLKSAFAPPKFAKNGELASILDERIVMKNGEQKVTLVERSENAFLLNNEKVPKLKKTESAVTLFSEEACIAPIGEAFKQILFSETLRRKSLNAQVNPEDLMTETNNALETFKENLVQQPTVIKAYQFQKRYPQEFSLIKQYFTDIFSSVEDIKVTVSRKTEGFDFYFNIKEKASKEWIPQPEMSSGMFRTLVHLTELFLAPRKCVVVIDEFENSLGINCMRDLIDFFLGKTPLMQFILTSHHPYTVSTIPWKAWQLVTRKGSHVRVTNATKISQLQTASSLNKFFQLTNLPEFDEEGIL